MHVQCTTLFLCKLPKTTCSHHPLTLMLVSHSGHGSAFSAALPCPSYVHSAHIDTHTRHRQRRTHHFTLVSDFIPFPSTLCYSALSTHESPPPHHLPSLSHKRSLSPQDIFFLFFICNLLSQLLTSSPCLLLFLRHCPHSLCVSPLPESSSFSFKNQSPVGVNISAAVYMCETLFVHRLTHRTVCVFIFVNLNIVWTDFYAV